MAEVILALSETRQLATRVTWNDTGWVPASEVQPVGFNNAALDLRERIMMRDLVTNAANAHNIVLPSASPRNPSTGATVPGNTLASQSVSDRQPLVAPQSNSKGVDGSLWQSGAVVGYSVDMFPSETRALQFTPVMRPESVSPKPPDIVVIGLNADHGILHGIIGPVGGRVTEARYQASTGAFEVSAYAQNAGDEKPNPCGKKLGEVWNVQTLSRQDGSKWLIIMKIIFYEKCIEVIVGGGRWDGRQIVPDPKLPTKPLPPTIDGGVVKTPGGDTVRIVVVRFGNGDTIETGADGSGKNEERSGGIVIIESDCKDWRLHRFKKGKQKIDYCDPNMKSYEQGSDDWSPDSPRGGFAPEPGQGGNRIQVDVPGDWPQGVKALGERGAYKKYTVNRTFLSVICCGGKIIAAFLYVMTRTYNFTCAKDNQSSTYDGWTPTGGAPITIDPGNPPKDGEAKDAWDWAQKNVKC